MKKRIIAMLLCFNMMLSLVLQFAPVVKAENSNTENNTVIENTLQPTAEPTVEPTTEPTTEPAAEPTAEPTTEPTVEPTTEPTAEPTTEPTVEPTTEPTTEPTVEPTTEPTVEPTTEPTVEPTTEPTAEPTAEPTVEPTTEPTVEPIAEQADDTEYYHPFYYPDKYLNKTAYFSLEYDGYVVFDAPSEYSEEIGVPDDTYFVYNDTTLNGEPIDEVPVNDMPLTITDYRYDDVQEILWFKVESASETPLPAKMEDKPYVLYMTAIDYQESYPPSLNIEFIEAEPENTPPQLGDGYTVEAVDHGYGYFTNQQVILSARPEATCMDIAEIKDTSVFGVFNVAFRVTQGENVWYLLRGLDSSLTGVEWKDYYLSENEVTLVTKSVAEQYNEFMATVSVDEFEQIMAETESEILEQFTDKLFSYINRHYENLVKAETRQVVSAPVTIDGKNVVVEVKGLLPEEVASVTATTVPAQTIVSDPAFGFDSEDQIYMALDIKMLDENGAEVQPKPGKSVAVSIDVSEIYPDGTVLGLHHKHGDSVESFNVMVVEDGKLTAVVDSFSIFVISNFNLFLTNAQNNRWNNNLNGQRLTANNNELHITVGDTVVYYLNDIRYSNNNSNAEFDNNNFRSTWWVDDPKGAIYYEIYSNKAASSTGTNGRWLRVTALETTAEYDKTSDSYINEQPVTLIYKYARLNNDDQQAAARYGQQTYTLHVDPPKADAGTTKLYIKDDINRYGKVTAVLVDENGKEVEFDDIDSVVFTWQRSDSIGIVPTAYEDEGQSVNICKDHGGIRTLDMDDDETTNNFTDPVTYTVTVQLPNAAPKTASYTVFFQSQIVNASFESPASSDNKSYTFYPNGWPGLFWKTTSPGTGSDTDANNGNRWNRVSRDIEFIRYGDGVNNGNFSQYVEFWPNRPDTGNQIAEINAENYGALYQDIITVPGENLNWSFAHSKRDDGYEGDGKNNSSTRPKEAMFLLIGPTEDAQTLLYYDEHIKPLLDQVSPEDKIDMSQNGTSRTVVNGTTGVQYTIWYHDADTDTTITQDQWKKLTGEYIVPEGQWRTRRFFISEPPESGIREANYGNLLDSAGGSMHKTYLVEYFELKHNDDHTTTIIHRPEFNETLTEADLAAGAEWPLMYTSIPLQNYKHFEGSNYDPETGTYSENDILTAVYINGRPSPYDIHYVHDDPTLYIENYGTYTYGKETGQLNHWDVDCDIPAEYIDQRDYYLENIYYKAATLNSETNKKENYDIVMQVVFSDSALVVEKKLEIEDYDKLQTHIGNMLSVDEPYITHMDVVCDACHENVDYKNIPQNIKFACHDMKITTIYGGSAIAEMGENPSADHNFSVIEVSATPLEGLYLEKVKIEQHHDNVSGADQHLMFDNIVTKDGKIVSATRHQHTEVDGEHVEIGQPVENSLVRISGIEMDADNLTARVVVTNVYKEKEITINYVAVGGGKILTVDKTNPTKEKSETAMYYTTVPVGVTVDPDEGYEFDGWYLDEKCTIRLDESYGYIDQTEENKGAFKPTKHSIIKNGDMEVTYYAKFSTGSIQVVRRDAFPNETFIYKVDVYKGSDASSGIDETIYVTIQANNIVDSSSAYGSAEIVGVAPDNQLVVVTQLNDWSWRYKNEPAPEDDIISQNHNKTEGAFGSLNMTTSFVFEDDFTTTQWLSFRRALAKNKYTIGGTT